MMMFRCNNQYSTTHFFPAKSISENISFCSPTLNWTVNLDFFSATSFLGSDDLHAIFQFWIISCKEYYFDKILK
jgi:hypothetical protein